MNTKLSCLTILPMLSNDELLDNTLFFISCSFCYLLEIAERNTILYLASDFLKCFILMIAKKQSIIFNHILLIVLSTQDSRNSTDSIIYFI